MFTSTAEFETCPHLRTRLGAKLLTIVLVIWAVLASGPSQALEPVPPTSGITPGACTSATLSTHPWRDVGRGMCFRDLEEGQRHYCIDWWHRLPSYFTPENATDIRGWCWNDVQTIPQFFSSLFTPRKPFDVGKNSGCQNPRNNPCNVGTGNKYQHEADYAGSAFAGFQFARHYNSISTYAGSFGPNWRGTFDRKVVPGTTLGPLAFVITPNGGAIPFDKVASAWVPRTDGTGKLQQLASGWRYTSANDEIEDFNAKGQLLTITTRTGLVFTMVYSNGSASGPNGGTYEGTSVALAAGLLIKVLSPFGQELGFHYNTSNTVARVTDPSGANLLYAYAPNGNVASVTYPTSPASSRIYHYENATFTSALTGITDENATRFATWTYDATGRSASSEHAGGVEKAAFVFNADGTTTVSDYVGNPASPTISTRKYSFQTVVGVVKTTSITDPATGLPAPCAGCGDIRTSSYDAQGNTASRTDWNGNQTTFTYDLTRNLETRRVEAAATPQARTITTEWHATFRLPRRIAEPLRITTLVYNGDSGAACGYKADGVTLVPGVLCSSTIQPTTDASGAAGFSATPSGTPRISTWTYNPNGMALTADGPRTDVSDVTTYTYHADNDPDPGKRGNLATVTNPLGHVTSITAYNAHGQPVTIIDPNGLTTTLAYDARGRMTSRTTGSEQTTYTHDPAGQLTRVTLPDGSYLDYTYDAAHRLTQIADPLGNRIEYTLDLTGNRTLEQRFDQFGNLAQTLSRVYSNLNRLSQVIGAEGQATQLAYDPQGNLTAVDGPLAGASDTTGYTYDALNRRTRTTDALSGQVNVAYDGLDQVVSVTDPRSLATGYTVDGLGNLTQQASPDSGTTTRTFDAAGNVLSATDAQGRVSTFQYDALNRVTVQGFAGQSIQYTWDQGTNGKGRLTGVSFPGNGLTAPAGSTAYSYDAHGRLLTKTERHAFATPIENTLAYTYSSTTGQRLTMTYPSGRVLEYFYDAAGRVNRIDLDGAALLTGVSYHPFGAPSGWGGGGTPWVTRVHDLDGRLESFTLGLSTRNVEYDDASRITALRHQSNPANDQTYSYDLLDRVTGYTANATSRGYAYDATGNRTGVTVGGVPYAYTVAGTSNRLTSTAGPQAQSFAHDAAGNVTGDGISTYAYDSRARMVSAQSGAVTHEYNYNGSGERTVRISPGGTSIYEATSAYLYDETGKLVGEYTASGSQSREHLYLGDLPVRLIHGAGTGALHKVYADQVGRPWLVASSSNGVRWDWTTEPFGANAPAVVPSSFSYSQRFPGQFADSVSGTFYNYFRDYDPRVGRYLQSDPIGLEGGINTYGYVGGNPISRTDPSGLFWPTPDTVWDVGNLVYDIWHGNWEDAAWDAAAMCIPGVPAGITKLRKVPMTKDQRALKEIVDEATNGGRKPLARQDAETVLDWAKETNYPGWRAKAGDVASPSNWNSNPIPHIHLPGSGRGGHIPVAPGVKPR